MFKFQKIVQGICIAGLATAFIFSIVYGKGYFLPYFAMYGLLCMIPIGLTQFFGSFFHNLEYGAESKLRTHFKASLVTIVVLLLAILTSYLGMNVPGAILSSAGMLSSVFLMVYFWVIIFKKEQSNSTI